MRLLTLVVAAVLSAAPVAVAVPAQAVDPVPSPRVTAWQGGPLHAGTTAGESIDPALGVAWTVNLPRASHALIGDGRAYVLSGRTSAPSSYGTELHAFDIATGQRLWGPVPLGGTYWWAGHALDGDRVFTVTYNGLLRSHDAATGVVLWSVQLSQYAFSSPPTAVDGTVYVGGAGGGGTLYAVDAKTGALRWSRPVANGDHSSPVVTADRVYVSYACGRAYAFQRSDGQPLWVRSTGCSGGGGKTAVLHNGRLYVRDHSYPAVLDAATGAVVGGLTTNVIPAFKGDVGYFLEGGTLTARQLSTDTVLWRQAGDGDLSGAPYIAGRFVYVGGGGRSLNAFRLSDGRRLWRGDVRVDPTDEHNVSSPYDGITVAGGTLLVSGGDTLTAMRNVQDLPPAMTITSGPADGAVIGRNVKFSFRASTSGTAASCELDGVAAPCTSPVAYSDLPAGDHVFRVQGMNAVGTGAWVQRRFSVDVEPPQPSVTIMPMQFSTYASPSWSATDNRAGVGSFDVRHRQSVAGQAFGTWVYRSDLQRTTLRAASFAAGPGTTTCVSVRARDLVGNLSTWSPQTCTSAPYDDRQLAASPEWFRGASSVAYQQTFTGSATAGAVLGRTLTARKLAIVATQCPECGVVQVLRDGAVIAEIHLSGPLTDRVVKDVPWPRLATATVELRVRDEGAGVQVDGLWAPR